MEPLQDQNTRRAKLTAVTVLEDRRPGAHKIQKLHKRVPDIKEKEVTVANLY